jgi:hypothetical protein
MDANQLMLLNFVGTCTIPNAIGVRLVVEVLDSFANVQNSITPKSIRNDLKIYGSRAANAGRILLSSIQTQKFIDMTLWVQDMLRINYVMVLNDFTNAQGQDARSRHIDRGLCVDASARVDRTLFPTFPKHPGAKFEAWTKLVFNYFQSIVGRNGVALTYLLRPNNAPAASALTPAAAGFATYAEMARLCCTIDNGNLCTFDKDKLYSELISRIESTAAMDWLPTDHETTRDGRAAYLALTAHYAHIESPAVKLARAEKMRSALHYKDEKSRSFELVMGDAQNCFRML